MTFAEEDLHKAAQQLAKSETGHAAMKDLLRFLDNQGLSLDQVNKDAAITLLAGAFGSYPGTTRDAMRAALGE